MSCLHNPQFVPDLSKRFSKSWRPLKWTQSEFTKYRLTVKLILSPSSTETLQFCSKPWKTHDYGWVLLWVFWFAWDQRPRAKNLMCVWNHIKKKNWTLRIWKCQSSQSFSALKRMILQHQKHSNQDNDTVFKSTEGSHCFWKRCHDLLAPIPYKQTIQLFKLN